MIDRRRMLSVLAAAPFLGRLPRASAASDFDPDFGSASDAARAVRTGAISSRELAAHVFERIRKYNPRVNADLTLAEDQSAARARAAACGLGYNRTMPKTLFPAFLIAVLLVGACFAQSIAVGPSASPAQPPKGRILGIGGVFFKSEHPGEMRQWYAKNLGLSDKGQGAMLHWRDRDNPQQERTTAWAIFPAASKYFEPGQLMVNYIVDDLDAMLDRLSKAGVKIDPKRQNESYGKFAWVYDPDGNKIELWQPADSPK